MPLIRSSVNRRADEALARLARNAASDAECLRELAREAFERAARVDEPAGYVDRHVGGEPAGVGGRHVGDEPAGVGGQYVGGEPASGGGQHVGGEPASCNDRHVGGCNGLTKDGAMFTDGWTRGGEPAGGGGRRERAALGGGGDGDGEAAVVMLRTAALAGAPSAILARVALIAFERVAAPRPLRDLRREHVEAAAEALARPATGKVVCAPGGLRARGVYGGVIFYSEAPPLSLHTTPDSLARAPLPRLLKTFLTKDERVVEQVGNISYNSFVQFFDAEAALSGISAGALELRRRKPGDRFFPIRSPGRKSLKDYFIDEKIPREERGEILLLADGKEIMWVVGRRVSDAYKVTDATRVVLRVALEFEPARNPR